MKILICGDRHWKNKKLIEEAVKQYKPTLIIEGGAMGADHIAGLIAKEKNIPLKEFFPDWMSHGKAAGPIRNKQMLVEGVPDMVIAFHNDLAASKGTKNMIEQATKAGVKVIHIKEEVMNDNTKQKNAGKSN